MQELQMGAFCDPLYAPYITPTDYHFSKIFLDKLFMEEWFES